MRRAYFGGGRAIGVFPILVNWNPSWIPIKLRQSTAFSPVQIPGPIGRPLSPGGAWTTCGAWTSALASRSTTGRPMTTMSVVYEADSELVIWYFRLGIGRSGYRQ